MGRGSMAHTLSRIIESSPSSSGRPQLDILFLCETFLKPSVPDSLYAVPRFSVYCRERLSNGGRGIMASINQDLTTKHRSDLKSQEIEAIWLETSIDYPGKHLSTTIFIY